MVICAVLFGLFNASIGGIVMEVAYLLAGVELFPMVYGYSTAICALGWMLGAPLAGNKNIKFCNLSINSSVHFSR